MFHSAFQLNREFIARICSKIQKLKEQHADDGHFSRLLMSTSPVSIDQLAMIVDTAHWASQAIEEGDQLQFSIVFKKHELSSNIFIFDHPLPLDATNLVKLGSALESSFSDICVGPDGNGSVNIWGLRMRAPNDLTTDLWIQVLGPGNLLIICYGRSIAAVINNQALFVDPTRFFKAIVPKIFSNEVDFDKIDVAKFHRLYAIMYIAQAMRAHKNGGTLLVVPEGNAWKKSIVHPVSYTGGTHFFQNQFTSNTPPSMPSLRELLSIYQKAVETQDEQFIKVRSQILDQCNRIGRLTAIDGAMVMTYDSHIKCFGAKIQTVAAPSGSTEIRVMQPAEGDDGTKSTFTDIGGSRHYSAAQFAYDRPESIAIVASQSGSISFFSKCPSTGELLVIQKAELALMYGGVSGIIWNLFEFMDNGHDGKGA